MLTKSFPIASAPIPSFSCSNMGISIPNVIETALMTINVSNNQCPANLFGNKWTRDFSYFQDRLNLEFLIKIIKESKNSPMGGLANEMGLRMLEWDLDVSEQMGKITKQEKSEWIAFSRDVVVLVDKALSGNDQAMATIKKLWGIPFSKIVASNMKNQN